MIFDSHSHYDDRAFDEDREKVLKSMQAGGVGNIVCVASDWSSLEKINNIVVKYDFCHAALGIHPNNASELTPENRLLLEKLIAETKPVAIGEIGLDYYYDEPSPEIQREAFIYQLDLANRFDLPVIIHSREATEETLETIRKHTPSKKGVIHCFSSSVEIAREYVKMGFMIGIGGVVTFKNGVKLKEVAADIPLDSLLIETDCPYLAPVPFRGKRNSSLYLPYVVEEIAALRNISCSEVISATEANAKKLFNIQ